MRLLRITGAHLHLPSEPHRDDHAGSAHTVRANANGRCGPVRGNPGGRDAERGKPGRCCPARGEPHRSNSRRRLRVPRRRPAPRRPAVGAARRGCSAFLPLQPPRNGLRAFAALPRPGSCKRIPVSHVCRGAKLEGADLDEADLRGAQLHGVVLDGAGLERAQVRLQGLIHSTALRPCFFWVFLSGSVTYVPALYCFNHCFSAPSLGSVCVYVCRVGRLRSLLTGIVSCSA